MASITWLIPSLLEGSGGHRTILQHADYLQKKGHHCVLYLENPEQLSNSALRKEIKRLFGYDFAEIRAGWTEISPADLIFATVWYSARVVRDLSFPCVKAYFIQDFEAQFNPMGDGYLMAENSYRYGLYPITIGRWLPAVLERQFDLEGAYFDFCANLDIYHPLPEISREQAICFIHQPDKPRRCAILGIEALGIVKYLMPEVKIYLYGSKAMGRIWFEHENLGLLNLEDCNRLYNRCTVGLCISSTNPSRIPFEMMAAGLPVVEIHRDNTLYDFPQQSTLLCESTPESLAHGLIDLLTDPKRANAMGKAGMQFMQNRPLEYGLEQFRSAVEMLLAGKKPNHQPNVLMYQQPALIANGPAAMGGSHSGPTIDYGRLTVLPLPLRKLVRFFYHPLRRLFS